MPDPPPFFTTLWGLRRHPFDPSIAREGERIEGHSYDEPLDPTEEPAMLAYLHDIYQHAAEEDRLLGGLDGDARAEFFPQPALMPDNQGKALMILLSGTGATGMTSLKNWIRYRFEQQAANTPLFIETRLTGESADNAKRVARQFARQFAAGRDEAVKNRLREIYEDETMGESALKPPYYPALFDEYADVADEADRRIVLLLRGYDYHKIWDDLYLTLRRFADLILVESKDPAQARVLHGSLTARRGNAALIHAPRLDLSRARSYLRERLSRERPADAPPDLKDSLRPFSEEALQALYLPTQGYRAEAQERSRLQKQMRRRLGDVGSGGSSSDEGNSIDAALTWPIRFINQSLRAALDARTRRLEALDPTTLDKMRRDDPDSLIGEEEMKVAREILNKSRRRK